MHSPLLSAGEPATGPKANYPALAGYEDLVSVLDLDKTALLIRSCWISRPSHTRATSSSDVVSLCTMSIFVRLDGTMSKDTERSNRRMMVGRGGLEPPTSRLSGVRSNHLSYRPTLNSPCEFNGRGKRIASAICGALGAILGAIRSATRPSGSRISSRNPAATQPIAKRLFMVERIGIEPMTPCLQSRCSPS